MKRHDLSSLDGILGEALATAPGKRLERIYSLVAALPKPNAERCYQELLAYPVLMQHEADALQMLGQRLNQPVIFRHAVLAHSQPLTWREGRYPDA